MATYITGRIVQDSSLTLKDLAQSSGAFTFRNKIINGDMSVDQRNNGGVATIPVNAVTYSLDRWYGLGRGSNITHQRVPATAPWVSYALRTTGAANNTQAEATQRIESNNAASLAGQKVTISFYITSSVTKNFNLFVARPTSAADNYSSTTLIDTYSFTANPTLTYHTYTLDLPSQVNLGLAVGVVTAAGSGGLGAGQSFDLTGVQVELGSDATPFESRPAGIELALCQRYYEYINTVYVPFLRVNDTGGGVYFKATKRVNPALRCINPNTKVSPGGLYYYCCVAGLTWFNNDAPNSSPWGFAASSPNYCFPYLAAYVPPGTDDAAGLIDVEANAEII